MKAKYKGFELPVNPSCLEVLSSTNCESKGSISANSFCENVFVNPTVVTGQGELYGDKGGEYCSLIQNMLKSTSSDWLFIPGFAPIKAFLTEFKYSRSVSNGAYQYSFKFVEDCKGKSAKRFVAYTIAQRGENAFDIADRCGIAVDDVMSLNDFKSPFDISEGEKVVII